MNEFWNLDPIYTGFDDPAFEADLNTAKEKLAAFTAFTATLAEAEPVKLCAPASNCRSSSASWPASWACTHLCASPPTAVIPKLLPRWAG